MRKAVFWMGSITALLSLAGFYLCLLIKAVFPKVMYGLFDIFGGRYSGAKLALDFTGLYVLCIVAFVAGVGVAIWAYKSETKGKNL